MLHYRAPINPTTLGKVGVVMMFFATIRALLKLSKVPGYGCQG